MKALIAIAVLAILGSAVLASEPVEWSDLIDQSAQTFDDPYRDLSYDEIENLKTIVLMREALAQGGQTEQQKNELELKAYDARLRFLESGIDADWLIDQRWAVAERRKKAVTAGNPAVDGQVIVLSGYAIPAPSDADGKPIAYLVPERGMCSHMAPPNANQMVRVRLTDEWQPSVVHEPVRLTGRISISPTHEVIRIVDGPVQMNATFAMEVERVETLADIEGQAEVGATNDWAEALAEKLRTSGALPAAPQEVTE